MKSTNIKRRAIKTIILVQIIAFVITGFAGYLWSSLLDRNIGEYSELSFTYEGYFKNRTAELYINTVEDWNSFAEKVNNGEHYGDTTVFLADDLDFSCQNFIIVGTEDNPFMGSFIGNNHTISNIAITSSEHYVGLFGYIRSAGIMGIVVDNCQITTDSSFSTGGIVGFASYGAIINCSYKGAISADGGSVGGIVGSNWATIECCETHGDVNGSVGLSWYYDHYIKGVGGIAGDNVGTITYCKNYANAYNNEPLHDSGGIAGCNYNLIQSCVNYGSTKSGIVNSNNEYSFVNGCINFGDANVGIAYQAYQNSAIEHCVNLGLVDGQFAADIASSCIEKDIGADYGGISHCLYINSSKSGAVRADHGIKSIHDNYQIKKIADPDMIKLQAYLDANDYAGALSFIIQLETQRRDSVVEVCLALAGFIFLFTDSGLLLNENLRIRKIYAQGNMNFRSGEYSKALSLWSSISEYRDCDTLIRDTLKSIFHNCKVSDTIELGESGGATIQWVCVHAENCKLVLISQCALCMAQVNSGTEPVSWKETELYNLLNKKYKKIWFDKKIREVLQIEITIPTVDEARSFFIDSEQRRCKPIRKFYDVLVNDEYVFWWLRNEGDKAAAKMPFVTGDGLISIIGKSIVSNNISVRPIIEMRINDENSI